jgi:radical SAM superfamily enzyme YgiQ (UPF0313 family)
MQNYDPYSRNRDQAVVMMGKNMKVLVIDALGSGSGVRFSSRDAVGCGPRSVAGVVESFGSEAKMLSAEQFLEKPELANYYDLLMVSAMSIDRQAVHKIICSWRNNHKSDLAIIGGPIAGQPMFLLNFGFDTIIVGEGERSLQILLKNGSQDNRFAKYRKKIILDGIPYKGRTGGFTRWINERISQQTLSSEHRALNSFSASVKCIRDYPGYSALRFYVEVARGCSNFRRTSIPLPDGRRCTECQKCRIGELEERVVCPVNIPPGCGFCSVPSLFGCSRSRNEKAIVKEVRELIKAGVRRIVLSASDFLDYQRDQMVPTHPLTDPCNPPPNINEIESLLAKLMSIQQTLGLTERDYVYVSVENIKPCLFNDEVASVIARYLPKSTIHLGCETGSEEHSSKLGRPSSPAQALDAVRTAAKHGLRPYVYFIHGLPGQTSQTATDTVDMMKQMVKTGAEKITLYRFKPLPLSAFEMFPPASPAKRDENSDKIERIARRLNMESKSNLLGKTLDVITCKPVSEGRREGTISYPVSDGPVVLLSRQNFKQGKRLKVKIIEVLSDRLVKGELA